MKQTLKKCKHCGNILLPLYPPCEEYLSTKFCIRIFGYKFLLVKEDIEVGCIECEIEEKRAKERDMIDDVVEMRIAKEIERGRLFVGE
jgi:hypothetical protein